jgi:hypothetical protein
VVSVLATLPKVRDGDGFLRTIKIHSMPTFGGEVKPSIPCRKILQHVKETFETLNKYFVG